MLHGAGSDEAETSDLDLGGMWRAMASRKSWIIGTTAICVIGALAFDFGVKPRFTADSQVLIENQASFFAGPAAAGPETPPDDAAVASQIQLATSRDLARQAIAKLGLVHSPEFNPRSSSPGLVGRLMSLAGLRKSPDAVRVEDTVLQNYYDRLNVYQVAKSRVLSVDFTSSSPDLAARASNAIADLYIDVQISAKRQEARSAAASLAVQIAQLQKQLATAEDEAESFRASSGLLVGANNTTLTSQQLADLNTQLSSARAAQADASAKANLIRSIIAKGALDEISEVANNDLVRQISLQRVGLRSQIALLSRTLLPRHPQIIALRAQLVDVDAQLRNAAMVAARGLENDAQVAEQRYDNLRATLDQQKQAVGDSGANEVRMRQLDRTAKALSDQLDATAAKYQEALARETATSMPGDARVISRAIAPELPSYPRKLPTLIFAVLAGLVLSAAAAIAAELMAQPGNGPQAPPRRRDRDRSGDDRLAGVEAELRRRAAGRAAAAGAVSRAPADQTAVDHAQPGFAEIRGERWDLASYVERAGEIARQAKCAACVLVTGASESAPAGAAALELGRRLAGQGRSILVELNPGLLSEAGLSAHAHSGGLDDLVEGRRSFAEVIDRDDASRLHLIAAGAASAPSGEALDIAIEALGETYDYVVLLGAPLAAGALTRDLAGAADLVALVGAELKERVEELRLQFLRVGAGEVAPLERAFDRDEPRSRVDAA